MMESNNLKTLKLLEAIAEGHPKSQRELASTLEISLGLVNAFLKRLVRKGYCKVKTIPKNRVNYILTPAGAMEKTRLTYEYIATSYRYFKAAMDKTHALYTELQTAGDNRVVFYGTGELAEIALLSMKGTAIRLVDVVDPEMAGGGFAHLVVKLPAQLKMIDFDVLLVTSLDNHTSILNDIKKYVDSMEKVRFFH